MPAKLKMYKVVKVWFVKAKDLIDISKKAKTLKRDADEIKISEPRDW